MNIYSPSSTIDYYTCPLMWRLRKAGWRSKKIGKPELAAAVGIGFAKAMEVYYGGRGLETEGLTGGAIQEGQDAARNFLDPLFDRGASVYPTDEKTYSLVLPRIKKAVEGYLKKFSLPDGWTDFQTELAFPDQGNARIDLLCNTPSGPTVADFKTKVTATDWRVTSSLFDFETSWAMHHYVWALRENHIQVDNYAIILVVIEPSVKVYLEQYSVDEEALEQWHRDALYWWRLMGGVVDKEKVFGFLGVTRAPEHRNKYGLCRYYDLCINHRLNEESARPDYLKLGG